MRGASSPFDGMMQRMEQRMQEHHQMANQMMSNMMKGFGGDPFANDPFFKEGAGSFKIFDDMRNEMKRAMAEPMSMGRDGGGMGQGRFMQMQSKTSTKQD